MALLLVPRERTPKAAPLLAGRANDSPGSHRLAALVDDQLPTISVRAVAPAAPQQVLLAGEAAPLIENLLGDEFPAPDWIERRRTVSAPQGTAYPRAAGPHGHFYVGGCTGAADEPIGTPALV